VRREAVRIAPKHCAHMGARHRIEVALGDKPDDPVTFIPPNALEESAARANELVLASDDDAAAAWHRTMAAVTELANKTPSRRVH